MIELYLLEQLDAFARNGTLIRASEELHISQPALSRSMKSWKMRPAWHYFTGMAEK